VRRRAPAGGLSPEMDTGVTRDWRDLVRAHLQAHCDDVRAHLEFAFSNAESRLINEFGSERLRRGYERDAQDRCDSLLPPPPEDCYEVIEESSCRLLVEVRRSDRRPDTLRVPIMTTRFLLTLGSAGWQTDAIFVPCFCNLQVGPPPFDPGRCMFCGGTGKSLGGKIIVQGFWPFRRRGLIQEPCKHCGGTGTCQKCATEKVPGWLSVFSIDGLRERPAEKRIPS
jgi:hypothetical protein